MALYSGYRRFTKKPAPIIPIGQEKDPLRPKEFLRCLGQAIRDSRKQKAMTQERLSEVAGVSAKYLSEVEQGRSNVTVLFLLRVARALDLNASTLLCGCEEGSEDHRLRKEIWDQLQKLKQPELRQVVRILRAMGETEDQDAP